MDLLACLQYPGAALGLIGAYLVSQRQARERRRGFALWVLSNACLIIWAATRQDPAWGLLAMYIIYSATSVMGWMNNREPSAS